MLCRMIVAATLAVLAFAQPVQAGPYSDKLGACMNSGINDQDRVTLARWFMILMAAHPDLKPMVAVTDAQRLEVHRKVADMFVKLLSETCRAETVEAVKFEGPAALQNAGQLLGQFAAQGVMTNPQVQTEGNTFATMIDGTKLDFLRALAPTP